MVTRSNGFPLADDKTPSLVTLSRTGPITLQGPHQLFGSHDKNLKGCLIHVERGVLRVEVSHDDLGLDLQSLFESLMMCDRHVS